MTTPRRKLTNMFVMKAINNKTGETVTNFNISAEYGTVTYVDRDGLVRVCDIVDGEWTLIEESCTEQKSFDLDSFRKETARMIMLRLISDNGYYINHSDEAIAKNSISLADEFIRQISVDVGAKDKSEK